MAVMIAEVVETVTAEAAAVEIAEAAVAVKEGIADIDRPVITVKRIRKFLKIVQDVTTQKNKA